MTFNNEFTEQDLYTDLSRVSRNLFQVARDLETEGDKFTASEIDEQLIIINDILSKLEIDAP